MTKEQINKLCDDGGFPENSERPELIETHISWVILCERLVYKIKKPIRYSFLDFSTIEKRKYFCSREIALNRRLSDDLYIDVQAVKEKAGKFFIGRGNGKIIDYAVSMRKLDRNLQMDLLLSNNKVTGANIAALAEKIAGFHKKARIITDKDVLDIQKLFADLGEESDYLNRQLDIGSDIIHRALATSTHFLKTHTTHLERRLEAGFFRDCHGDLHSRNIFFLPSPQPFDCIEFNDDYRQIDVLNEIAFMCMDLDAFYREDLSALFLKSYNALFPCMLTQEDHRLFIFYKAYRSNIRAKVNSLRANSSINNAEKKSALAEAYRYLCLMDSYVQQLNSK